MDHQPSSFWQKTLLHGFADECIWHAIVPTIMVSTTPTWEFVEQCINTEDQQLVLAQRANMCCVECGMPMEKTTCRLAIRVLIAQRKVRSMPDDGRQYIINRIALCSAIFCLPCFEKNTIAVSLDANSDMLNVVLDALEIIAANDFSLPQLEANKQSGPEIWNNMVALLQLQQQELMHRMGKKDAKCFFCNKNGPKRRCSACHYARYCGSDCSHSDWVRHKPECAFLQKNSVVLPLWTGREEKVNHT